MQLCYAASNKHKHSAITNTSVSGGSDKYTNKQAKKQTAITKASVQVSVAAVTSVQMQCASVRAWRAVTSVSIVVCKTQVEVLVHHGQ